jgi:hypothetical protein
MTRLLHTLRQHWRLVLLVAIVLMLLPMVVAAEDRLPEPEPELPAISEPLAKQAVTDETPEPQPFSVYREMIERPLFSSTRRPPVIRDTPQENLDAQQLREIWRLTGIAMEQGRQLASFRERQGERHALLEVGMLLTDDWRLESIGSDHVQLSNDRGEVYMPLREPVTAEESAARAKARKALRQENKTAVPAEPEAPTDNTPSEGPVEAGQG